MINTTGVQCEYYSEIPPRGEPIHESGEPHMYERKLITLSSSNDTLHVKREHCSSSNCDLTYIEMNKGSSTRKQKSEESHVHYEHTIVNTSDTEYDIAYVDMNEGKRKLADKIN